MPKTFTENLAAVIWSCRSALRTLSDPSRNRCPRESIYDGCNERWRYAGRRLPFLVELRKTFRSRLHLAPATVAKHENQLVRLDHLGKNFLIAQCDDFDYLRSSFSAFHQPRPPAPPVLPAARRVGDGMGRLEFLRKFIIFDWFLVVVSAQAMFTTVSGFAIVAKIYVVDVARAVTHHAAIMATVSHLCLHGSGSI